MLKANFIFLFTFFSLIINAQVSIDSTSLANDAYCPNDSIVFDFEVDANRNLTHLSINKGMGEYCNKKYIDFFVAKFDSIRTTIPYELKQYTMPGDEDICLCYKGYYMDGKKRYRKRNYAAAISYFDKGINANAEYTKSYRYKGLCQIKLRNIDAGCESLKKAMQLGDRAAKKEYPEFCK